MAEGTDVKSHRSMKVHVMFREQQETPRKWSARCLMVELEGTCIAEDVEWQPKEFTFKFLGDSVV